MVDHQVDVTYIVQVDIWRELVRNDHGPGSMNLRTSYQGLLLVIWNAKN